MCKLVKGLKSGCNSFIITVHVAVISLPTYYVFCCLYFLAQFYHWWILFLVLGCLDYGTGMQCNQLFQLEGNFVYTCRSSLPPVLDCLHYAKTGQCTFSLLQCTYSPKRGWTFFQVFLHCLKEHASTMLCQQLVILATGSYLLLDRWPMFVQQTKMAVDCAQPEHLTRYILEYGSGDATLSQPRPQTTPRFYLAAVEKTFLHSCEIKSGSGLGTRLTVSYNALNLLESVIQ